MARSILTAQARRIFSEFPATIDKYALVRYFTLTAQDRQVIGRCRGSHNRLGFACQIGWLRWPPTPRFTPTCVGISAVAIFRRALILRHGHHAVGHQAGGEETLSK
ncbi:MAG: DUF4158 domain-containing protein [Chloroflexi bacterium]|nr:DUF4158 domain-containing protein [Chloroflexota bacterium]